jgi:hypothetical protein
MRPPATSRLPDGPALFFLHDGRTDDLMVAIHDHFSARHSNGSDNPARDSASDNYDDSVITQKTEAGGANRVFGYDAYFGTYTIDDKAQIVTHHLESPCAVSSLITDTVGADLGSGGVNALALPSKLVL